MAQEEVTYTIPSQGGIGSKVDAIFTTSDTPNADGSFTVTGATGTYQTLNAAGAVVDTDKITGISPVGTLAENDNELFISANPATSPIVTLGGVSYTISNPADSGDGKGNVDFYDGNGSNAGIVPSDNTALNPPLYFEDETVSNNPNNAPANSVTETAVVCFASGTLITTSRGLVAVEQLSLGDLVVTASGEHRPVRWLGHRDVDCRFHPRPHETLPVRIAANAFGEGLPMRDLRVSPGHAIRVDVLGEVLVPASALINGVTIIQEQVDHVTYWHVELESHDVIVAENLPCESYIEMGNRCFFAESDVVAFAASPDVAAAHRTHVDFCLPFQSHGPLADAARAKLAARATMLQAEIASPVGDKALVA